MNQQINDFTNILTYAHEACSKYELNEIDSEVLLFAIADDMNCMAYEVMTNAGYNVNKLKKVLRERFKINKPETYIAGSPFSVSVEGLIALHALHYGGRPLTTITMLKTIIRNDNTAAARLLRAECISLNYNNELTYKPLI
ncbi:hypothetical protein IDJ75_10600 [Mucilaginibacter rigui]|uniref:Clp R domain-containing protein n=1 Tax=Mucilaginibacter rigui TaxID=534635 RepID=A0ABR7X561_9SPHI|nr:Clp protease N-terminal domain-containing protein [Mucilaginibacter rigui]MBD1385728.1 hypothetical protein [Mucilaginibacter rigui]